MKKEYDKWVHQTHSNLTDMKQGSKAWWKLERQLQQQKQKCCSIPALKHGKKEWVRDSTGKANLLAKTLSGKYMLAEQTANEYSILTDEKLEWVSDRAKILHLAAARKHYAST